MGQDLLELLEKAIARWHDRVGLLAGCVLVSGLVALTPLAWPTSAVGNLLLWGAVAGFWLWSRRPPRPRPGRVGVAVVIAPPETPAEIAFATDFVDELRRLLMRGRAGKSFQVIVAPAHIARRWIAGDVDLLESLRQQMRCHFVLGGKVRARKLNGQDHLVLDLSGAVAHRPIPDEVQQVFQKEFSELLPSRIALPSDQDLLAFTFTGEWTNLVAKYIIGIAAALSGDLDYAQSLYESVRDEALAKTVESPVADKIVGRIPQRLAEVHEARANAAFKTWRDAKKPEIAAAIKDNLEQIDPALLSNRRYASLRAIAAFVVDKDPEAALAQLEPMKREADGVWYWNAGFLHAYKGNLKKAAQLYRKGALAGLPPDVPAQLEEFMTWVLAEEPALTQIHYCLGILNRDIKEDARRTLEEFEAFVHLTPPGRFEKEVQLAREWLAGHKDG